MCNEVGGGVEKEKQKKKQSKSSKQLCDKNVHRPAKKMLTNAVWFFMKTTQ